MGEQVPGVDGIGAVGATPRRAAWMRAGSSFLQLRWASILVVAVALGIYFAISNENFLSVANLLTLAEFLAEVAIITAGEVMLMICGEIHLSVGRGLALPPFAT